MSRDASVQLSHFLVVQRSKDGLGDAVECLGVLVVSLLANVHGDVVKDVDARVLYEGQSQCRDTTVCGEHLTEGAVVVCGFGVDDSGVKNQLLLVSKFNSGRGFGQNQTVRTARELGLHADHGVRVRVDVLHHRLQGEGSAILLSDLRAGGETVGVVERRASQPHDSVISQILLTNTRGQFLGVEAGVGVSEVHGPSGAVVLHVGVNVTGQEGLTGHVGST